ncbi:hypothetical protein V1478_001154, partial [Vespula squamosa]
MNFLKEFQPTPSIERNASLTRMKITLDREIQRIRISPWNEDRDGTIVITDIRFVQRKDLSLPKDRLSPSPALPVDSSFHLGARKFPFSEERRKLWDFR